MIYRCPLQTRHDLNCTICICIAGAGSSVPGTIHSAYLDGQSAIWGLIEVEMRGLRISRLLMKLPEISQLNAMIFQSFRSSIYLLSGKFWDFYVFHVRGFDSLSHVTHEFPVNVVPDILNQATRSILLQQH